MPVAIQEQLEPVGFRDEFEQTHVLVCFEVQVGEHIVMKSGGVGAAGDGHLDANRGFNARLCVAN